MNRILSINDADAASRELQKINVSSGGIESMFPKMDSLCIKLENVRLPAANILKQEMLSLGGDAAVARGVVNGEVPISEVILMGNTMKYRRLAAKLNYQTYFGLPKIKDDILRLIKNRKGEKFRKLDFSSKEIDLTQTQVMGILNITPDSFSDGNEYYSADKAVSHAEQLISEGASIIDIGGESTRPGAEEVTAEEELKRVIPVIKKLHSISDVVISCDTQKSEVAKAAIESGAHIINDISALGYDENMAEVIRQNPNVKVILMHMQGKPRTMQKAPHYDDVIREVTDFLAERINYCIENGIDRSRIIIDPGIGFGKRQEDNLMIMQRLSEFHCLDCPVLLGASRKSFIGRIYESSAQQREAGTLATTALAVQSGIHMVRVHNVLANHQLISTLSAIKRQL